MAITRLFRTAAFAAFVALFMLNIRPADAVIEDDDLSVTDATVTYVLHFELVAMREFRKAPHGSNTQSRQAVMGYLLPGDAPEEIIALMQDKVGNLIHRAATEGGIEMNGKWVPLTPGHCYDIPTRVHYNAEGKPDNVRTLDVLDVTDTKDHSQYKELLEEQEGSSDPEA